MPRGRDTAARWRPPASRSRTRRCRWAPAAAPAWTRRAAGGRPTWGCRTARASPRPSPNSSRWSETGALAVDNRTRSTWRSLSRSNGSGSNSESQGSDGRCEAVVREWSLVLGTEAVRSRKASCAPNSETGYTDDLYFWIRMRLSSRKDS